MELLLAGLIGLISGVLGGVVGGTGVTRRIMRRLGELDDDVASLDRRLSRREGLAGREKRLSVQEEIAAEITKAGGPARLLAQAAAARTPAAASSASPPDHNAILAQGRRNGLGRLAPGQVE